MVIVQEFYWFNNITYCIHTYVQVQYAPLHILCLNPIFRGDFFTENKLDFKILIHSTPSSKNGPLSEISLHP